MKKRIVGGFIIVMLILSVAVLSGCVEEGGQQLGSDGELPTFKSYQEIYYIFEDAKNSNRRSAVVYKSDLVAFETMTAPQAATAEDTTSTTYSDTNIQVEGVDEADIVKTDGKYIYTLSGGKLIIVRAYPAEKAEILFEDSIHNFNPKELFIHRDRLLIFGRTSYCADVDEIFVNGEFGEFIIPGRHTSLTVARLYDVSDSEDPELLRVIELEGDYISSRKIGEHVYFVTTSYPYRFEKDDPRGIIPLYRDNTENFELVSEATDISYIPPVNPEGFITVVGMSMEDEDGDVYKKTVVGSGQNVYASLENLYISQTKRPHYYWRYGNDEEIEEETIVTKFRLKDGEIEFKGTGDVPGHILNQFSMDEYDNHFRIATTIGHVSRMRESHSTNNIYVLNDELEIVGSLKDLAPGERIYSARFMGKRGYLVTFKKVDPLFVVDLSDHENPEVLGKLKIPGYSDYLHPYDEDHIIGLGKETVEAEEGDFAWYQGIKMAIFDVSDVENPLELHKEVIGDRGTDSPALHNHKAFLFDKEKKLLVLPVKVAEIRGERTRDNQYGDFVFQGAYTYDVSLDDGFDLRGKVSHYDEDDEVYKKSGYYFYGDKNIERSLYIGNVLYTLSNSRIQLNELDTLEKLKELNFDKEGEN
ncbi:MAG: beta-propeller domain-containing protein [Halobacteriota archaeon]|nr:beta-propeller domain-containing protein [Halobacteriota archaeon]